MTIYKRIKDTVTALDTAQMYGLNVRSNGMTNCPFHEDHNPSLKLDRYFYCFGCHAHGDVIDFVSRLFDISRYDAAQRIAEDFGIYYPPPTRTNPITNNAEPYRPSAPFCIFLLRDYPHLLWIWRIRYEPTTITELPDDRYVEACKNIPIVNDLIDDLRDGDKEFQNRAMAILLENENWKRLQEYVRKQKKEEAACGERTNEQYALYELWCDENSGKAVSPKSFGNYMCQNEKQLNLERSNNVRNRDGRRVWGFWGMEPVLKLYV